jgi:hypothetical protein
MTSVGCSRSPGPATATIYAIDITPESNTNEQASEKFSIPQSRSILTSPKFSIILPCLST